MPQAPWRWTSTLAPSVTLLLVGESLTWGGPGPLPIVVIIFVVERCVCVRGGLSSLCKAQPSPLSHLFLAAWLVRHPVSGTCDYPHGYGFCWFAWCSRSLPETFCFLCFGHAQGLGNYPTAGIWLAQADGGLLHGGPIPPCLIIVLTSTRVLPTDGANCRVLI